MSGDWLRQRRFIIGMAELHPEKAFIGVETQHDIAYYPGKTAKENKMDNIKVICANAEHMEDWFEPGEIKRIIFEFQRSVAEKRVTPKRRLTHRKFSLAKISKDFFRKKADTCVFKNG